MKLSQLQSKVRAALFTLLAFTSAFTITTTFAASRTYTTNADFDEGTLFNVNHDIPDQIQLNAVTTTFPVMWIANGGEDTVSKIDTNTGRETARYRTWFGPAGQPGHLNHLNNPWAGAAPSRTAVDGNGNVYVANRHFDGRQSVILKILATGGIDRNGNSVIDTSSDLNNDGVIANPSAEILPLGDANNNGVLDAGELADERVAWAVRVGAVNGLCRSLSIGPDGHLWVGLYNSQQYYKISSVDGSLLLGPVAVGHTPYGSLVDAGGTLYSASLSNRMTKMNTVAPHSPQHFFHSGTNYGIAIGNSKVYLALHNFSANVVGVFDPGTNAFSYFSLPGIGGALGISVDSNGDIVLSASNAVGGGSFLGASKLRPDGSIIWTKGAQAGANGGDQRGAIVDSNGDVWTVNRVNNSVSKFRGTDGAALGVFPVGNHPYTYSDASGSAFLQSNPTGNWTIVHDTGFLGTSNGTISWSDSVPAVGASLIVEIRAANTQAALATQTFVAATNGGSVPMGVSGRYWEVKATLSGTAGQTLITPILFDLTIVTNQPPTVVCPAPVAVQCPGPASLEFQVADADGDTVTYDVSIDGTSVQTGSVSGSGAVSVTHNFTSGTHNVVVTVNDGKSSGTCSTTVTVKDTEVPTLTCPQDIVVSTDAGRCDAAVSFAATAQDNCSAATITYSRAPGSVFAKGSTTVNVTATDASGNSTSCQFTVTVNDTEAPKLVCPSNLVVSNDPGLCAAAVSYNASATDNCGPVTVSYSIASGSTFPKGSTTVNVTAKDAAGNESTCSFTVTVNDAEAPKIVCPENIVVNTDPGVCSAVVNFAATASDNCGGPGVTYSVPSGSAFPKGTTTVTATATDSSGNSSSCSFTVTVNDAEAPAITCPANIVVGNDAGLCSAVVNYAATASDNCGATTITYSIAPGSVFQSGTTTVTATATDSSGNSSSCSFTVTVNDTQAPSANCVPTTNPSGNNEPGGKSNGKNGQNPDGFYQLLGTDNCDAPSALGVYVKDSASDFVAGPFKSGDKVKITQAPGVKPNSKPMSGVIVAHIQLKGDALVVVKDSAGNSSVVASCLVPPFPK